VALAEHFRTLLSQLPDDWADARFVARFADEGRATRASALLGGIGAGRHVDAVRFATTRGGAGHGPDVVGRALRRLDEEGIRGELELVSSGRAVPAVEAARPTLAASWDAAVAGLPPDWSDVYAEVELTSTDYLERAALLLSPVNPARDAGRPVFRFRCASSHGYGAAPGLVRRCFERCDEERIRGEVRILRALSETRHWSTQGPVWYVGGKAV
jgi:hypothetical protein